MIVCCDFDGTSPDVYERVAQVLSEYGVAFHAEAGHSMPLVRATNGTRLAAAIRSALRKNRGLPLFYFGHGRRGPAALLGKGEAVLLEKADWPLLHGRVICALACYSIDGLGRELRKLGASVLGYTGWFQVIYREPGTSLMRPAALAAPRALAGGATLNEAMKAGTSAYDRLATRLYTSENMGERILGPFVEQNARAMDISGDGRRKMEWPS